MNEKNSLGLNLCFKDHNNPIKLFEEWFNKAKKSEINDPNAFAVGTCLLYTSPSPRDLSTSRMPSSA